MRSLASLVILTFAATGCAATQRGLRRNAPQIATGVALAAVAAAANAAANAPPPKPKSDEAIEAGERDRRRRRNEAAIQADERLEAIEDDAPLAFPPP